MTIANDSIQQSAAIVKRKAVMTWATIFYLLFCLDRLKSIWVRFVILSIIRIQPRPPQHVAWLNQQIPTGEITEERLRSMNFQGVWNMDFIDKQYRQWQADPGSVGPDWQLFFKGFDLGRQQIGEQDEQGYSRHALLQAQVESLIYRYRTLGHTIAYINPLYDRETREKIIWDLSEFGLEPDAIDRIFYARHFSASGNLSLKEIIVALQTTYCRSIGVEYMHIQDTEERLWLQQKMESCRNIPVLSDEQEIRTLNTLYQAGIFEQYLHNKYLGQKRFSLEGAESLIPMLDTAIDELAQHGSVEIVLGMAHRGRLNVLVNILWKLYEEVFCEFEDNFDPESVTGSSDVRYHKGYMVERTTRFAKKMRILLAPNPSHLESVDPVVQGITRGRQLHLHDKDARQKVVPMLLHGDAAFAGQGMVAEVFNLAQLEGFRTGGTIHIIINNQIGFTTSPKDARSTRYSTDVAKMSMTPIFHVNAEDPEATIYVIQLACEYRMRFNKDVVIDLLCYRRYGHNEGDEPLFTQPQMYDEIKQHHSVYQSYGQKLLTQGKISEEQIAKIREDIEQCLNHGFEAARAKVHEMPVEPFYDSWEKLPTRYSHQSVATGLDADRLRTLARKLNRLPDGFRIHHKLQRILDKRLKAVEEGKGIDWANAEALAFASLVTQGYLVRISGQDSGRGTFSQRHSVLYDINDGKKYVPLQHLQQDQAIFVIFDSALSEASVLGFEYGRSLVHPDDMIIWEAQFGDFVNGAQVIIDQYIVSAESKWRRCSNLTMLLPHAYEGQGPDHSSARIERFLMMAAEDNIQISNLTTPAQYFHILRRQMLRDFRKPLILFTPKSLLRHPQAVSTLADLSEQKFHEVIADDIDQPKRVVFCSGKVYYDLAENRPNDVAIVRMEQLYPFPESQLQEAMKRYSSVGECVWVQEEPQNMGAWHFIRPYLRRILGRKIHYVGRAIAASPATGLAKIHSRQQQKIITEAFAQKLPNSALS